MSHRNKSKSQTPSLVQTTNNQASITSPFQTATQHKTLPGPDQTNTSVPPLYSTLPLQYTADQDYEPTNNDNTNDYTDMNANPNAYTNLAYNIHSTDNNTSPNAILPYVNASHNNTEYEYVMHQ